MFAVSLLFVFQSWAYALPEAGTQLHNQASIHFYDTLSNLWISQNSNTVSSEVQPLEQISLQSDQTLVRAPGAPAELHHTLRNTGNTTSTITLNALNRSGDDFDLPDLALFIDNNANGIADSGDIQIDHTPVTLKAGEYINLVLRGTVPPDTSRHQAANITLTATTAAQGKTASNTDTIEINESAIIQITKSASNLAPLPGQEVQFTITGSNVGSASAVSVSQVGEHTIVLNGAPQDLLFVYDQIPANTEYVAGSLRGDVGGTPLYHQAGDAPFRFSTTEPEQVDGVGFAVSGFDTETSGRFSFAVRIFDTASGSIVNTARLYYNDGISTDPTIADSNPVELILPPKAPEINYFTSETFSSITGSTHLGEPLYVQAQASQCNQSPLVAETHLIRITSDLTGDSEVFPATETEPNSGLFRILPEVPTRDAVSYPVASGNGIVETRESDSLIAEVQGCGGQTASANVLIDPYGVVYDSRSNEAVSGVTVTLIDVTGEGNGGSPGGAAVVFDTDGLTPAPSTVTTDSEGRFHFPLVPASTYRLEVASSNGYSFPSQLPPALQPAGRILDAQGSFGSNFIVSHATGAVRLDLPLDPGPADGLFLEKTASRAVAEIGDFVDYTLKLQNGTGKTISQITLFDRLPGGFSLQRGTLRLNGVPLANEGDQNGPLLELALGDLPNDQTVKVTYRVKLGVGANLGDGINRAQAQGRYGTLSNMATARVEVSEGVFTDKGYIIGKVFVDGNRNRIQDPEELGIPGVRLYLENGSFVVTDSEGKYSFYGISPGTHVLKVDTTSLPVGSEMLTLSNRHAGEATSRFIDLKNGEIHKANFAEGSATQEILDQVKNRRAKGEVFSAESERTLNRELRFEETETTLDSARSLPAHGLLNDSADERQLRLLTDGRADREELEIPSKPEAPVSTEKEFLKKLEQQDTSLAIVSPGNNQVLDVPQTNIWIKGTSGAEFRLFVNDIPVPGSRLGRQMTHQDKNLEVRQYVGINLNSGINTLRLEQYDPFGNPRGSATSQVIAPGRLKRIDLAAPKENFPADGQSLIPIELHLYDADGVPYPSAVHLTVETSLGRWQLEDLAPSEEGIQTVIEGGQGQLMLVAPREPGDAMIRISSGDLEAQAPLSFVPELRPMIASGLIEGTISLTRLGSGSIEGIDPQDSFEKELSHFSRNGDNGRLNAGARTAFFLKGKIKGDMLLTVAYDSDKETRERLFRDIQPDKFYPVYGDSSIRGYDAQSTSRLYVRVDKEKTYLLYGDYTTRDQSAARNLGAYNRSLTGFKGHYETGRLKANVFASYDTSTQVTEEIRGKGVSGPYLLKGDNILENSEKVELLIRDRNQSSVVLETIPQNRFADYELEPFSGRLLFKAPVPSVDENLNPIFIRVTYEVRQGGEDFWIAGTDAQFKLTERIELGGAYIQDENPQDKANLASANATFRLTENTYLITEWAQSFRDSFGRGNAERIELRHNSDDLSGHLFAARTDTDFDNPSAGFGSGRTEIGSRFNLRLSSKTTLSGEALHSEDEGTNGHRSGAFVSIGHELSRHLKGEIGLRYSRESEEAASDETQGVGPIEYTSVHTRLDATVPSLPKLNIYGEYEQAFDSAKNEMAAVGGDYQVAGKTRVYVRHEFISSLGGDYTLNDSQHQNTTIVGLDTEYMKNGSLFSEYRMRDAVDGRDAEAAIGLRNAWYVTEGLTLNTSFERIQNVQGDSDDEQTALTGAIEYLASARLKGTARLELRYGNSSNGILSTLGVAHKLNRNVTLLGKNILDYTDNKDGIGDVLQNRFQLGMAYRPTDTDVWNALTRVEYKYERDDSDEDAPVGRRVLILSGHLNVQPHNRLTLSGHYAGKLVHERSNHITSRSNAHLLSGRVLYDLTERWDAGLTASTLFEDTFDSYQYGLGAELGYLLTANLWLSGGYNLFGFYDEDLSAGNYTNPGVYMRMRFKFDETLLQGSDPRQNIEKASLASTAENNAEKEEPTEALLPGNSDTKPPGRLPGVRATEARPIQVVKAEFEPPQTSLVISAPSPTGQGFADETQSLPALVVSDIMYCWHIEKRKAVVNNQAVSRGDLVEGALVDNILKDRVRFLFNTRYYEVRLAKTAQGGQSDNQ